MDRQNISADARYLVIIQALYFGAAALGSVFLSIFLFRLGNFSTLVLFNLLAYAGLLVSFNASGFVLGKFPSKSILTFGQICLSLFWLLMTVLQENSVHYVIPLGLLIGLGQGTFWSGLNLTQYIVTHAATRNEYFGRAFTWSNFARAIGPMAGGALIQLSRTFSGRPYSGYFLLFFLVLLLNLANIIVTQKLPHHSGVEFSLRHFLTHRRSGLWKMVLVQQFFAGLYDVAFPVIASILIYLIVQGEFLLGVVSTGTAILSGISSYYAPWLLKRIPRLPLLSSLVASAGMLIFGFAVNPLGLIILAITTGLSLPIVNIAMSSLVLNTIDTNPDPWQLKYHMLLERDTSLGFARVLTYGMLLAAFTLSTQHAVATTWIKGVAVLPAFLGVLIDKSHK